MREHLSVRKFTDEQILPETLRDIIEAGRAASTWRNIQSYSIIIVRDPAHRHQIAQWTGMPWVETCAEFLVFVGDLHRAGIAAVEYGTQIETKGAEPLLVTAVDAALAAQNTLLAAESLGYGGVFIGYVRNSSAEVSALLGLPDHTFPLFGLCLGRPQAKQPAKARLPYEAVVFEDRYGQIDPSDLSGYDKTQADYLAAIGAPAGMPWTKIASSMWAGPGQQSSTENLKAKGLL